MYTLIMCIGMTWGICSQVMRIDYPTRAECRAE